MAPALTVILPITFEKRGLEGGNLLFLGDEEGEGGGFGPVKGLFHSKIWLL